MTLQRRTALSLLAGLAFVTGCVNLPFRTEGDAPFGPDRGLERKTVESKEPPSRLVAVDGTVCIVSGSRYAGVEPGDRVLCDWRPRGR